MSSPYHLRSSSEIGIGLEPDKDFSDAPRRSLFDYQSKEDRDSQRTTEMHSKYIHKKTYVYIYIYMYINIFKKKSGPKGYVAKFGKFYAAMLYVLYILSTSFISYVFRYMFVHLLYSDPP